MTLAFFPEPCLCGRFGGDEFCVYCSHSPIRQELEKRLSRLLNDVKEIDIINGEEFVVSMSVGAVIVHGYAEFDDIYGKADEMLYQVKKTGRDKFCISEME